MTKVTTNRAVKTSCKNTKVRTASGACAPERKPMMKSGGTTFGMLSVKAGVDKNPKATAADRIAGAKMSNKKMAKGGMTRSLKKSQMGGTSTMGSYDPGSGIQTSNMPSPQARRGGVVKKTLPKAQDGKITDTTKYKPWSKTNIKPTLIEPLYMDPRETLKLEQRARLKETQDKYNVNKLAGKTKYTGPKSTVKKLGGATHPGFKAVQSKIAAKQGISKEAAGAILASSARKASAKAKAANPRLKKVK